MAAFACSTVLFAQTDSTALDEVVVTATKYAKRQGETGKVLTVIGQDILQRSVGKNLSQLLNEQAGIIINGANTNYGKDKSVFVRGAKAGYTSILMDGIPMSDASSIDGAFDLRLVDISQIERIEILKGGQSTLYGSDAIAGVINIITKKGGKNTFDITQTVSYGSFNTFNAHTNIFGATSEKFNYNLNVGRIKTDGISEVNVNNGDLDGSDMFNLNLNLGIKLGQHFILKPFIRYNKFEGSFDDGAGADAKNTFKSDLLHAGVNISSPFWKGTMNWSFSYQKAKRDYHYDGQFGVSDFAYNGTILQSELFYNRKFNERVELLVGLDRRDYKNENDGSMPANPTYKMLAQYASVFLKDILETKGLNLEAGFRVNIHSEYGTNITWSLNPSLSISKNVRLFANASTAFKAPTLDQLYGAYGANTGLNPEKAFTLESGVQFVADENKLSLRFVGFYRKINDVITYVTTNPATFNAKYLNFDKQEDSGFEFEFSVKASDELTINGNYTYVDGTLTTKDYATNAERKVTGLLRRPRNQYNVNAVLQATNKLSFSLGLQSFGKRFDSNFGTEVELADYILVNGYCEYTLNNHFKFFADAQNMLGAKYEEVYGYNVLPTNLRVGVVAKF